MHFKLSYLAKKMNLHRTLKNRHVNREEFKALTLNRNEELDANFTITRKSLLI
jgi:hypothetical protein